MRMETPQTPKVWVKYGRGVSFRTWEGRGQCRLSKFLALEMHNNFGAFSDPSDEHTVDENFQVKTFP